MRIAYLLDFYGDVLDEHSRGVMRSYYEDDLSLAEIADGIGISRQGVRHIIKKSEEQLEFLEEKLGLADKFSFIDEAIGIIEENTAALSLCEDEKIRNAAEKISVAAKKIKSKNN